MGVTLHKIPVVEGGRNYLEVYDDTNDPESTNPQVPTRQYVDKRPIYFTGIITDISTAASHFVVCPIAGDITKIYSTIDNAITVANAGLSFEIGGTAVTDGGITVTASGSAAGDVDSATPTAENTLTAGQAIEMITDGASTTVCRATITFEVTPA